MLGWLRLGLVCIDCVSYPTFSMTSVDLIVSRCSLRLPPINRLQPIASASVDRIGSRPNLLAQGRSYRLTADVIGSQPIPSPQSRQHCLQPILSAAGDHIGLHPTASAPSDHIVSKPIPSPHSRRHRLQPITSAPAKHISFQPMTSSPADRIGSRRSHRLTANPFPSQPIP